MQLKLLLNKSMLIIGLGNPGAEYINTRHNIGFKAVEAIASSLNCSFKIHSKFKSEIATAQYLGNKIILLKPQTYMNLSGEAVSIAKNYYNIPINNIVVFHDEMDIKLGTMRYKIGGGSAGHNGIKSIDQHIGKEYNRVRIGIGRPENGQEVADYVLSKFASSEKNTINRVLEHIAASYSGLLTGDFNSIILSEL